MLAEEIMREPSVRSLERPTDFEILSSGKIISAMMEFARLSTFSEISINQKSV